MRAEQLIISDFACMHKIMSSSPLLILILIGYLYLYAPFPSGDLTALCCFATLTLRRVYNTPQLVNDKKDMASEITLWGIDGAAGSLGRQFARPHMEGQPKCVQFPCHAATELSPQP